MFSKNNIVLYRKKCACPDSLNYQIGNPDASCDHVLRVSYNDSQEERNLNSRVFEISIMGFNHLTVYSPKEGLVSRSVSIPISEIEKIKESLDKILEMHNSFVHKQEESF